MISGTSAIRQKVSSGGGLQSVVKGDVGTKFELTVVDENGDAVDVSAANPKEIVFVQPDGTEVAQTAEDTGDLGGLRYTVVAGDLDIAGGWAVYAHVVIGAAVWRSSPVRFEVRGVGI